jgi:hypothetical protein
MKLFNIFILWNIFESNFQRTFSKLHGSNKIQMNFRVFEIWNWFKLNFPRKDIGHYSPWAESGRPKLAWLTTLDWNRGPMVPKVKGSDSHRIWLTGDEGRWGRALEEAGSAWSPFWPSERGQAHRRRLPTAACVSQVGASVKGRWSSGGWSLSGRRGASRHDDARGGGGDTGRKPEEAGAVGIIVVEENWRGGL